MSPVDVRHGSEIERAVAAVARWSNVGLIVIGSAFAIIHRTFIDPVGAGFVASLAQPGGNATGFTIYEYSMSGKWLELLKEIAPRVTRAAVLRDPAVASGIGQFGAVQIVARSLGARDRERIELETLVAKATCGSASSTRWGKSARSCGQRSRSCGGSSGGPLMLCLRQFAFPHDALMLFACTLDAIFKLAPIVRELLGHGVSPARHIATDCRPDVHGLTNLKFMRRHRYVGSSFILASGE
jgi:hypothetical protein